MFAISTYLTLLLFFLFSDKIYAEHLKNVIHWVSALACIVYRYVELYYTNKYLFPNSYNIYYYIVELFIYFHIIMCVRYSV